MRNTLIFFFVIFFVITNTLCYCQETHTANEITNKEQKISYSFFTEYGFILGGFFEEALFSEELTGIWVNGISFNKKQDMIGVGIGCELYFLIIARAYPIFVNYRHYFPSKRSLKPLINVALGTRLSFWSEYDDWGPPIGIEEFPKLRCLAGLYSTIAGGFKVHNFSFTSGVFIKSWNNKSFLGGIEIKVGYAF